MSKKLSELKLDDIKLFQKLKCISHPEMVGYIFKIEQHDPIEWNPTQFDRVANIWVKWENGSIVVARSDSLPDNELIS